MALEFMEVITPLRSTMMPLKMRAVVMAMDVASTFSLLDSSLMLTCRLAMSSLGVLVPPAPEGGEGPPHEWRLHAISSLLHRCGGAMYSTGPCAGGRSESCTGGPE